MRNTVIVIAARNEASNIGAVVYKSLEYGDVIVVDDASEDFTATMSFLEGAMLVEHEAHTHIKQAYVDGFRLALGKDYCYLIQMDAGLSHDPDEIPRLLQSLGPARMVLGSRFLPGAKSRQTLWRRFLSRGGTLLVCLATGMTFTDVGSGFRAFEIKLLRELEQENVLSDLKATAHAFQFELLWQIHRRGHRIVEIPITYTAGESSVNAKVILEALWTVVRLLWTRVMQAPLRQLPSGARSRP